MFFATFLSRLIFLSFFTVFFQSVATAKKLEVDNFFGFKIAFTKLAVYSCIYGVFDVFGFDHQEVSKLAV